MKSKSCILLSLLCIISFSCQTDAGTKETKNQTQISKEIDYPSVAQKICDCVAPLAEINKEVEFMVKADRKDEAMNLLEEVQKRNETTEACLDKIEKEYPNAGLIESKMITSLLAKKCPATAEFLMNL